MCLIYAGSACAMYGIYTFVQINRCVCHCVHRCTSALCFPFKCTYTWVCVRFPPPLGPGCSAPLLGRGPFPFPGSRFPVPGSWFPVPGSHPAAVSGSPGPGVQEPMARKEPLLSALKGERGPPAPVRASPGRAWYRSDRTDGGAALGPPGPAPQPDRGSGEVYPSSCRRVGPCRGVGSPRGAVQRCPPGTRPLSPAGHPRVPPLSLLPAGAVLRLREGGGPCTDTSPRLVSLCQLLESILRKGLRRE